MNRTNYILSIDLGTNKVAALLGRSLGGEVTLCGFGLAPSEGLRRGEIVDLEKATSAIARSIAGIKPTSTQNPAAWLEAKSNIAPPSFKLPTRAWVGVTGDHIRCFNPRADITISRPGRPISRRDVEQVMRAAVDSVTLPPGHEVIHVIASTFSVETHDSARAPKKASFGRDAVSHNSIANPVGMPANRLEVQAHIVTASSSALSHLERCMEQAGLAVEGIVLEPLASADAVLTEAERDLGVVLIDIGAGTTDIAIFCNGSICYSGAVALGGAHITRDIAVGLEIDPDEAEKLKISRGSALIDRVGKDERVTINQLSDDQSRHIPRRRLAEIIQPRAAEMLSLAKEQIVSSGYFHRLSVGIVLTGGGSQLEGMIPLTKQIFGLPARLGRPFSRGPLELRDPRFSTGLGLLLYGSHEQVAVVSPFTWSQIKPSLAARLISWWKQVFGP